MTRVLPYLLSLTLASVAIGQEKKADPKSIENLSHLLDAALPGETGPPSTEFQEADLSQLLDRMVTRVTAVEPPAGFKPVDDADIPLGIPLDATLVRRAAARLWDTGSYSNVQIYARSGPGGGVELLIEVKPMLRLRRLEVSGNNALDDDDVARAVEYAPDRTILPEPEVLRKLKRKMLKTYADRGYREARASLRIETTKEPGGVALVVEIEEGRPDRYTRIRIPGLPEELTDKYIAGSVDLEEEMVRNRVEVEKSAQELVEKLAIEGYLDARIKQFRERRLDRYDVELVIPVEPGIRTELVFIKAEHFRAKELKEKLIGEGIFRTAPESLEQGVGRLIKHYRAYGFFHARIHAMRFCVDKRGKETKLSVKNTCGRGAVSQRLEFHIREGPPVEVTRINFDGNKYFSDDHLEEEIFAFMKERTESDDLFQPLTTETVDDLGLSDKRPPGLGQPRGAKSPQIKQALAYVPKLYLEAMDHLTGVYQEQGFLGVHVTDTCRIETHKPIIHRKKLFVPFKIIRQSDASPEESTKLPTPCVLINKDRNELLVMVAIKEGSQTRLNEIAFEGNTVFPTRKLQEVAAISVSDPYNEYRLRESSKEIASFYQNSGYMFAEVSWDKSFSLDMERARVVYMVEEGPQVRVGRIRIEGAELTSKKLILERMTVRPGDLITPRQIEESQQRLMELGVLSSATVQMISPEVPAEVKNLRVQVREGRPQYMELRGGMATVEGLRGGFEYGYRNIAGWAINARLRARANYRLFFLGNQNPVISQFEKYYRETLETPGNQIEYHLLLGLGQRHLPGTRGLLGWGIDAIQERVNDPAFSATRTTGFFRINTTHALGLKYRRAIAAEVRSGVELNDLVVLALEMLSDDEDDSEDRINNPVHQSYLRMPAGKSRFWVTGLKLTLDLRDHPFNPTKGIFASIGGDFVRSFGKDQWEYRDLVITEEADQDAPDFDERLESGEIKRISKMSKLIRAQATFSGYIPFGETDMVLALSVSAGYVFHLADNSTTWADRYFYAGGLDTLRGFPEESLVPEDIYQDWKTTLKDSSDEAGELLTQSGGEAMFMIRAEFRFPLSKGFFGALFSEAGNLWRNRKKMSLIDFDKPQINLRPVAGIGIRYLTPLGPLSSDLGINLFKRPHEELFAWYFSIGLAF
ncbi:MAG: BamA/TamA family outer membrane protein [Proteobacteria bacterium]|nr:BamA/TamA family outer membrane protein [Pseudomonadota bacterium]